MVSNLPLAKREPVRGVSDGQPKLFSRNRLRSWEEIPPRTRRPKFMIPMARKHRVSYRL